MPDRDLKLEDFEPIAVKILKTNGVLRFRARGESMRPFLWNGDVLEVEAVLPGFVKKGDIVLCRPDRGSILTHRVIGVIGNGEQRKLVIQGDALPWPDGSITPQQVLGRVVKVYRSGVQFSVNHPIIRLMVWIFLGLAPIRRRLYFLVHA